MMRHPLLKTPAQKLFQILHDVPYGSFFTVKIETQTKMNNHNIY